MTKTTTILTLIQVIGTGAKTLRAAATVKIKIYGEAVAEDVATTSSIKTISITTSKAEVVVRFRTTTIISRKEAQAGAVIRIRVVPAKVKFTLTVR